MAATVVQHLLVHNTWTCIADIVEAVEGAATPRDLVCVIHNLNRLLSRKLQGAHPASFRATALHEVLVLARARASDMCMSDDPAAPIFHDKCDEAARLLAIARTYDTAAEQGCLNKEDIAAMCIAMGCESPAQIQAFAAWTVAFEAWATAAAAAGRAPTQEDCFAKLETDCAHDPILQNVFKRICGLR